MVSIEVLPQAKAARTLLEELPSPAKPCLSTPIAQAGIPACLQQDSVLRHARH